MVQCSRSTCFAPESSCDLGYIDRARCKAWCGDGEAVSEKSETAADELLLPWSGSALGLVDLGFLAGKAKPLVVGIIGPQNAGKTTLLASWYLLAGRGLVCSERHRFAGSYSFVGWEAVAHSLRWNPGQQPGFPPHTTSRGGRTPGLLHMSFRSPDKEVRSYLFADAPGEWFQKWAVNSDSVDGEGARWVAQHADIFLLIADCEALASTHIGSARGALQLLARRLSAERGTRPVALVWTKSDVEIAPAIEQTVKEAVFGLMPDALEFSVSVTPGEDDESNTGRGLLDLFEWTLSARRQRISLPPVTTTATDPLFLFGTRP